MLQQNPTGFKSYSLNILLNLKKLEKYLFRYKIYCFYEVIYQNRCLHVFIFIFIFICLFLE